MKWEKFKSKYIKLNLDIYLRILHLPGKRKEVEQKMVQAIDLNQPIIIIEHCFNCSAHNWNNRHDENKYKQYALNVAEAVKERIPTA